jgi:hypothetical protein
LERGATRLVGRSLGEGGSAGPLSHGPRFKGIVWLFPPIFSNVFRLSLLSR